MCWFLKHRWLAMLGQLEFKQSHVLKSAMLKLCTTLGVALSWALCRLLITHWHIPLAADLWPFVAIICAEKSLCVYGYLSPSTNVNWCMHTPTVQFQFQELDWTEASLAFSEFYCVLVQGSTLIYSCLSLLDLISGLIGSAQKQSVTEVRFSPHNLDACANVNQTGLQASTEWSPTWIESIYKLMFCWKCRFD